MQSIDRMDLNLLRVLHVLLEELSVSRAANRLCLTQSAISKALQRLREALDDPLFLRTQRGLTPTPRALDLGVPLGRMFEQVELCVKSSSFVPATLDARVSIATPEQFAVLTIPRLLTRLDAIAPGIRLEVRHLMDNHLQLMSTGRLDFVINLEQAYPEGYSAKRIYSCAPMVWLRKEHPLARKRTIKIADLCAYRLITFHNQNLTVRDLRASEQAFAEAGLRQRPFLDTSHLLIALDVLVNSDAILLAPDYLSKSSIARDMIVPKPLSHIPEFTHLMIHLSVAQHERTAKSPLHQWLAAEMENLKGGRAS